MTLKKAIVIAVFIFLCMRLPKYVQDITLLVRGQMRLTLSRELAQYLVENDYSFPKNWEDFENHKRRSKLGTDSVVITNSVLRQKFSLPWGESLTNINVLSSVWFKSLDSQRPLEDAIFTRETLFNMWTISTNKEYVEALITIWDEKQQDE